MRGCTGKLGIVSALLPSEFKSAYPCQQIQLAILPTLRKYSPRLVLSAQLTFQNSKLAGAGFKKANGNLVQC